MVGLHGSILHYITQSLLYGWVARMHSILYNPDTYRAYSMAGSHVDILHYNPKTYIAYSSAGLHGNILHHMTHIHKEHIVRLGYMDTFYTI